MCKAYVKTHNKDFLQPIKVLLSTLVSFKDLRPSHQWLIVLDTQRGRSPGKLLQGEGHTQILEVVANNFDCSTDCSDKTIMSLS